MARYTTLKLAVRGRIATITLNRPERLNAIDDRMPGEIEAAVQRANDDARVHAIVLQGAGSAFCAGYDLRFYAEHAHAVNQPMPWQPMRDYRLMKRNTERFMSLWRSHKPTIAKVHGYAVAGGSDIALCCDLLVMADDAKIGYMPARVWGCPTTAMWVYRVGAMRAKRLLFTGDLIDGRTAADWGLATLAVPAGEIDVATQALAERVAGVPTAQLTMHKLVVNQAVEAMGLAQTQTLATLFDGITRHSPEGTWFRRYAEAHGFPAAAEWRDSGRALPELEPGDTGDAFMTPPAAADARSAWSRDVTGKRRVAARPKPGRR
ncbi:crotonase/enoyl-CoA hydratase family protein [Azohydromonas sp.]|uniref:crotonase/enoyl-CoA hydratase family protein n=1 Tax=Azohydromonas sp. TaxID=1872666 RepID=UPI002BD3CF91|nr:crotonase/enoyl-CoA hydratase family protein [Azohydromonas sp.]HMM84082.1 crotonase/enoyl-CoA hydratase family protein [Azohydromonas sp.]